MRRDPPDEKEPDPVGAAAQSAVHRRDRTLPLAVAGVVTVVAVVSAATVGWSHPRHGAEATLGTAGLPALPSPSAEVSTPVVVPTADPSVSRAVPSLPAPTGTPAATPTPALATGSCSGPLPPGAAAQPSCDVSHHHSGLPTDCASPGSACAWPDSRGAVPRGAYAVWPTVNGNMLHFTWKSDDLAGDSNAGPVHEFVVRVLSSDGTTIVAEKELPTTTFATDFGPLPPGEYTAIEQELNDSGLSAGLGDHNVTVAATASPTPGAGATPSASPSSAPGPAA